MSSFLAFDLGASSGRAIIGKLEKGRLSLTEVHRFANGPTEKDGAIYWNYPQLCSELKEGLRKALAVEPQLRGIGIDTWGVDYVFFDKKSGAMRRSFPFIYGGCAVLCRVFPRYCAPRLRRGQDMSLI